MCGTWTQEQWIAGTKNEIAGYENYYKLLGTFYNVEGQRALQIQNTWGDRYIRNVYSEDGRDEVTYIDGKREAKRLMKERGFTFKTNPTIGISGLQVETVVLDEAVEVEAAQANATVALVDTDPTTVTSPDQVTDDMVVQGRTIAQWAEESARNETRDTKQHVHPELPTGRYPYPLEQAAFIASSTVEESLFMLLMLSGAGDPGLVPSLF